MLSRSLIFWQRLYEKNEWNNCLLRLSQLITEDKDDANISFWRTIYSPFHEED